MERPVPRRRAPFWRGDPHMLPELAGVARARRPVRPGRPAGLGLGQLRHRHDGFTLADVVSYNEKHNEANGEDNRDGHDANSPTTSGSRGRPTTR
jgi:isoamylase